MQHPGGEPTRLSALFQPEPFKWGFRGDPYLWREMERHIAAHAYPATEEELVAEIETAFRQLTGVPVSHADPIYIERFSHGGMSSGYVSPQFWRESAIPLLRARYLDHPVEGRG